MVNSRIVAYLILIKAKRKLSSDNFDTAMEIDNSAIDGGKSRWIDLALLYKDIDEPEIFQNIYLTNVATKELPKEAINAEINGDYVEAYNAFGNSLEQDKDSLYEIPLWKEQMLWCHTQLTQWDEIATTVDKRIQNDPDSIWDIGQHVSYRLSF